MLNVLFCPVCDEAEFDSRGLVLGQEGLSSTRGEASHAKSITLNFCCHATVSRPHCEGRCTQRERRDVSWPREASNSDDAVKEPRRERRLPPRDPMWMNMGVFAPRDPPPKAPRTSMPRIRQV